MCVCVAGRFLDDIVIDHLVQLLHLLNLLLALGDEVGEAHLLSGQVLSDALSRRNSASRTLATDDLDRRLELAECRGLADGLLDCGLAIIKEALLLLGEHFLTSDEARLLHSGAESSASEICIVALLNVLAVQRLHHRTDALRLL